MIATTIVLAGVLVVAFGVLGSAKLAAVSGDARPS